MAGYPALRDFFFRREAATTANPMMMVADRFDRRRVRRGSIGADRRSRHTLLIIAIWMRIFPSLGALEQLAREALA